LVAAPNDLPVSRDGDFDRLHDDICDFGLTPHIELRRRTRHDFNSQDVSHWDSAQHVAQPAFGGRALSIDQHIARGATEPTNPIPVINRKSWQLTHHVFRCRRIEPGEVGGLEYLDV
jgi:hypothetical protein